MGYYVNITESTAVIPAAKEAEALRRFVLMNGPEMDIAKSGGSFSGGKQNEAWYSWMPSDYDKTATSAAEVLDLLGFETERTTDGDLAITGYDSKTGDEELFLFAIKDLFVPGSIIRWNGEDGAQWEHSFDGDGMFLREGGWNPTPPVRLRVRVFAYDFSPDRLHVDLVPHTTPLTPQEQAMRNGTPNHPLLAAV